MEILQLGKGVFVVTIYTFGVSWYYGEPAKQIYLCANSVLLLSSDWRCTSKIFHFSTSLIGPLEKVWLMINQYLWQNQHHRQFDTAATFPKMFKAAKTFFLFLHIVVSTLCWVETISGMVEVNRWRQKQNKLTKLKRCDSTLKCISERLTGKDAITAWFKLKYYNYWLSTRFTFITR